MASAASGAQMILKTTRHGLLASLREDADWDALVAEVRQLRARGLQTADDAAITFDLGWREIGPQQFDQLIEALTAQGLQCLGILSTSHQTRTVAEGRGYRAIIGRLGLAKHQGRKLRRAALAAEQSAAPEAPQASPETVSAPTQLTEPTPEQDAEASEARTAPRAADPTPPAPPAPVSTGAQTAPGSAPTSSGEPSDPSAGTPAPPPVLEEKPPAAPEKTAPAAAAAPVAPPVSSGVPPGDELAGPEASEPTSGQSAPSYGDEEPTLYLRRTLRSGQRVVFGGNVVLLGDLNPGAQIEADGDVIVLGQLRGAVHAGCEGDRDATVVATSLQATQLRIADNFFQRPSERTLFKRTSVASAVRARLEGDRIVLEPLPAKQ